MKKQEIKLTIERFSVELKLTKINKLDDYKKEFKPESENDYKSKNEMLIEENKNLKMRVDTYLQLTNELQVVEEILKTEIIKLRTQKVQKSMFNFN